MHKLMCAFNYFLSIFSTFHTQYKIQNQFRTINLYKNAQNGRSFDLRILERKKDNVDKTTTSI